jgi:hypothetical protein
MSEVRVNGRAVHVDSARQTWGVLLCTLDGQAVEEGHVVTAVRFEGVDQPSFRDPEVRARALLGLGSIDVDTVPRSGLLLSTLGQAGLGLPTIAGGARQAAAAFRRGATAEGLDGLRRVIETVGTLVQLTLAAAAVAKTDLRNLCCGSGSGADILAATGIVLDTLAAHQRTSDWLALADDLEGTLVPALLGWNDVFDAMRDESVARAASMRTA